MAWAIVSASRRVLLLDQALRARGPRIKPLTAATDTTTTVGKSAWMTTSPRTIAYILPKQEATRHGQWPTHTHSGGTVGTASGHPTEPPYPTPSTASHAHQPEPLRSADRHIELLGCQPGYCLHPRLRVHRQGTQVPMPALGLQHDRGGSRFGQVREGCVAELLRWFVASLPLDGSGVSRP